MYGKNVGKTIQGLVKVVVIIGMVFWIIAGLIVGVASEDGLVAVLALFGTAIACFCVWISGMLLYGFGALVESNIVMSDMLKSQGLVNGQMPYQGEGYAPVEPQQHTCVKCGKPLQDSATFCPACGYQV